jgi:hypothetical protein
LLFFYFVQWSLKLLRAFYRKIHRRINQKIYPQNNPKPFRPDLLPHCTTQQPQPRLNTPLSQINQKIYQPKTTQSRFRPETPNRSYPALCSSSWSVETNYKSLQVKHYDPLDPKFGNPNFDHFAMGPEIAKDPGRAEAYGAATGFLDLRHLRHRPIRRQRPGSVGQGSAAWTLRYIRRIRIEGQSRRRRSLPQRPVRSICTLPMTPSLFSRFARCRHHSRPDRRSAMAGCDVSGQIVFIFWMNWPDRFFLYTYVFFLL